MHSAIAVMTGLVIVALIAAMGKRQLFSFFVALFLIIAIPTLLSGLPHGQAIIDVFLLSVPVCVLAVIYLRSTLDGRKLWIGTKGGEK